MKKLLYSLAVLMLASACGQNAFTLQGTISDADQLPEGAVVSILDANKNELGTASIADGKFTFKGEAAPEAVYDVDVTYPEKNPRDRSWKAFFIPEKGTIAMTLSKSDFEVSGGTVNQAYEDLQKKLYDASVEMQDKIAGLADESKDEAEKLYDEFQAMKAAINKEAIAKNGSNYVAVAALRNIIYDIDLDELDKILGSCGEFVGKNESIKKTRDSKIAEQNTAEGKPFVDFSGKTPEGADIKLSDIVGQGRWVLADFWASWCGPCMREIPNIKRTHENLAGDKFTVLGIAVWDADDDGGNSKSFDKMGQMGMTWPQIFVGNDRTPTDLYGIVGIPTMILFAPDGTICKRGHALRGEQMMEKVSEIINQ